MAITRAQIARQLYQFGGGADAGKESDFGKENFGGGNKTGGDGVREQRISQQYKNVPKTTIKSGKDFRDTQKDKGLGSTVKNLIKQRAKQGYTLGSLIPGQTKRSQIRQRAYRDYLRRMGVTPPDTLTGEEDDLAEFFVENAFDKPVAEDAMLETPQSYGEFIAENFGDPGVMMSGDVGELETFVTERDETGKPIKYGFRNVGGGEGSNLLIPQGIMTQAPSDMDQEPKEEGGLRLAFRADGGRIGYKQGSSFFESLGFTPEHSAAVAEMDKNFSGSQFDYSAAATKDMVDRASNPLTTITSAIGNVVGRPFYDAVDAAKEYSKKGYQGEFSLSPTGVKDFTKNVFSLGKEFVDQRPDIMMAGALKGGIQSLGTQLGESIYDAINTPANADEIDFDIKKAMAREAKLKKQKMQEETIKKIKEKAAAKEAAQRQATKRMAEQNRQRGTGGFQSNFAQDKGFMGGSGTAAEMGSFAYGGRAGLAEGGMPYEGGIMDFESARQMYGLGKLVKKATRAVKKIAKSDLGKAALIGAVAFGIPGLGTAGGLGGGIFGRASFGGAAPGIFGFSGIGNALALGKMKAGNLLLGLPGDTGGRVAGTGLLSKIGPGTLITAASALAGLLTKDQEQKAQELSRGEGIDIEEARRMILQAGTSADRRGLAFRAEGGRIGYQEGSKEPVAKKTMPLLDMGGKEMDLREEGGFVPIGRMEKADDVPARLSKNEFVFTADAVRNAGDGDVDKGAEVMYNMMKNLEAGGDVSEESQGLEGARRMFQTSQRLEEVL